MPEAYHRREPRLGACVEREVPFTTFALLLNHAVDLDGAPRVAPIPEPVLLPQVVAEVAYQPVGEPQVINGCGRDLRWFDAEVKRRLNPIRYCYTRELQQHPELAGMVRLHFVLDTHGWVRSVGADRDTLGSPAVVACLEDLFHGLQFGVRHPGTTTYVVNYPLVFSPAE